MSAIVVGVIGVARGHQEVGLAFVFDLVFASAVQIAFFGMLPGDIRLRRRRRAGTGSQQSAPAVAARSKRNKRAAVRVCVVVMVSAASAVGGFVIGAGRGDGDPVAECRAVANRRVQIDSEARGRLRGEPAATEARKNQFRLGAAEELAILAEQNAHCYTPAERAEAEAVYRRWLRSAPT